MNNKQSSSIEWLYFAMEGFIHKSARVHFIEYFEQAKAMHKEEIIYSVEVGYTNGYLNKEYDGHQHYNETFNQETK